MLIKTVKVLIFKFINWIFFIFWSSSDNIFYPPKSAMDSVQPNIVHLFAIIIKDKQIASLQKSRSPYSLLKIFLIHAQLILFVNSLVADNNDKLKELLQFNFFLKIVTLTVLFTCFALCRVLKAILVKGKSCLLRNRKNIFWLRGRCNSDACSLVDLHSQL